MEYNFSYETGATVERTFVVTANSEEEAIELFSNHRYLSNNVKEREVILLTVGDCDEEDDTVIDLWYLKAGEFKEKKITI